MPKINLDTAPRRRGTSYPPPFDQPCLQRERVPFVPDDPLKVQIRHFCDVIRKGATPISSGREGLATLAVIDAVKRAIRTGEAVAPAVPAASAA